MWRKEPVLIALGGLDAAVVAVLSALMALDVIGIDGQQLAAISAAVVAVTSLAAAVLRANVVSPESWQEDVVDALYSPIPESEKADLSQFKGYLGDDA
jgi:hydroxyethylthiazole kinase-like sugar kinase family protein